MTDSVLDRMRQKRQRQLEIQATQAQTTLDELRAELVTVPETCRHSAIVLDKAIDQQLQLFCKQHKITVEVFLEATWLEASGKPDWIEPILVEAKRRYAARKEAGRLRRLITMLERQL